MKSNFKIYRHIASILWTNFCFSTFSVSVKSTLKRQVSCILLWHIFIHFKYFLKRSTSVFNQISKLYVNIVADVMPEETGTVEDETPEQDVQDEQKADDHDEIAAAEDASGETVEQPENETEDAEMEVESEGKENAEEQDISKDEIETQGMYFATYRVKFFHWCCGIVIIQYRLKSGFLEGVGLDSTLKTSGSWSSTIIMINSILYTFSSLSVD